MDLFYFSIKEKQSQAEEKREKKRAKAFIPPKEKTHASKPVVQGTLIFIFPKAALA